MIGLRFRPAASADVDDAYVWYESQERGLGERFLGELGSTLEAIAENPRRFPVMLRNTRRALVRRFPYGVFFRVLDDGVLVVACFHASRDPQRWGERT